VTDVHVESAHLDDGVALMYRDLGERVRLAFDPRQISEDAAIAVLCIHLPQLIGSVRVYRSPPDAPPQRSR
jgi:hypothetical protein